MNKKSKILTRINMPYRMGVDFKCGECSLHMILPETDNRLYCKIGERQVSNDDSCHIHSIALSEMIIDAGRILGFRAYTPKEEK